MGRHTAAMLTIAAMQMWLVSTVPIQVLAHAAYDDGLFVRLAISLLRGEWLGEYDSLTLVKGPVYPMWLAAIAWLGLPLLLAQDALYLLAGGLLLRLLRLRWAGVVIFAAYALNPMLTSTEQLRIIREDLYTPLVVLLMALVVWWWRWRERPLQSRLLPAVALGAVVSLLWMTREEGSWLLPPLALGALLCLGTPLLKRLLRDGALVGLAALIAWGGTQAVALINKAHYGVTEVVAFREPAFIAAYGALSRIEHDAWRRLIPVPREVVRRGAKHSPALADLAPWPTAGPRKVAGTMARHRVVARSTAAGSCGLCVARRRWPATMARRQRRATSTDSWRAKSISPAPTAASPAPRLATLSCHPTGSNICFLLASAGWRGYAAWSLSAMLA